MSFNLGTLRLTSGEGRRIDVPVALPPFEFGGQGYVPNPDRTEATLDVARTTGGGNSMRLRFAAALEGPCMRCLEEAGERIEVDSREVDQPGGGEDMLSPYVHDQELDIESWARDALALALPPQILCRDGCLGLCPECGADLNQAPAHSHPAKQDERFAKLKELRFD